MDSLELISTLDTFMKLAFVIAGVFLILAVILFFAFGIPEIYMMRSGKAQKKAVEKMKKINSDTGRLSLKSERGISGIFGSSADLDSVGMTTEIAAYQQPQGTVALNMPDSQSSTPPELIADQSYGKFNIVNTIMEVHTNEVI